LSRRIFLIVGVFIAIFLGTVLGIFAFFKRFTILKKFKSIKIPKEDVKQYLQDEEEIVVKETDK
jgi:hypothetical protein